MRIERNIYLNELIERMNNGMIKIVTGIRRCGKSYLLFTLFKEHLLLSGVPENHIIEIARPEAVLFVHQGAYQGRRTVLCDN